MITDEELLKIVNHFMQNKNTCMSFNYAGMNINELIEKDKQQVINDVKNEFQNLIGICGCGNPRIVYEGIYNYLYMLNDMYDKKDPIKEINEEKSKNKIEWIYDNWQNEFVAYILDNKGFTDHGTSIGGCWIEELGEWYLKIFEDKKFDWID